MQSKINLKKSYGKKATINNARPIMHLYLNILVE